MTSTFTWLDYSDGERRRVLDVVKSLGERGTRDELGIGTVRDALADLLAPGVSTIQTRARYFLLVPWVYQDLERRMRGRSQPTSKDWVTRRARTLETNLIPYLLESDDADGTIGISAGKAVRRLPSSVYWNGLAEWRIRLGPWNIDAYHQQLASLAARPKSSQQAADHAALMWHAGLPKPPEGFPEGISMRLPRHEAEYLRDRIIGSHSNSLLGQLVLDVPDLDHLDYPWQTLDVGIELPEGVAATVAHARRFALAMHGPVLIYNLMLAEQHPGGRDDWVDKYRAMIDEWARDVRDRGPDMARWDRADFWGTVQATSHRIPAPSRRFIDDWLDRLLESGEPAGLAGDRQVRQRIEERERRLKKQHARLGNPRKLELWNGNAGAGVARLDYRWPVMKTHLADIRDGLQRADEVAEVA